MITIEPTIKIYDDEGNLSRAYDKAVDKMIDKTYDIDLEQFDFDEVAKGKSKELDNLVAKLCKESGLGSKDIYTMLLDRFEAEYDVPVDFVIYLGKDWEDDFEESKESARKSIKESSVKCVTFEQIVDSRFEDISKGEKILNDRKDEIIELCGDDFSVYTNKIEFLDWEDDESQYRQRYYIRKNNNNVSWNDLYKIVNSVKAVPYKFDKINDSVFESRKSIKESHGFDEENEYMLGLSVVTNESLIEDTLEEDGLEIDWDYIGKVSAELDYAIERKFAKEIGHVAVEEFHDDNSYNCTFWIRFDDIKANKYMKNLNYFDDYTRGNSTVFMYDVDEILDNEIDKLEKKYDSDILGILRECVTVEIEVPTESVFDESKKSATKSINESKNTEIKVYLDGHTTPSNKYQDYDFSPYSKKYEIVGLTEFKDDVILTFERGKAKSFTYLGVTVDFDKENNAKCKDWECEIDIDEVQEYIIKFRLSLFV